MLSVTAHSNGFVIASHVSAAMLYGMVSASFAIEQNGPPRLTTVGEQELWNGEDPLERLRDLTTWTEHEY